MNYWGNENRRGFFWSGCENVKERVQESWRALDTKFVFDSFYQIVWEKSPTIFNL